MEVKFIAPRYTLEEVDEVISRENKIAQEETSKKHLFIYRSISAIGKVAALMLYGYFLDNYLLSLVSLSEDIRIKFILLMGIPVLGLFIFVIICKCINHIKNVFIRKGYIVENPFQGSKIYEYYQDAYSLIDFISKYESVSLCRDDFYKKITAKGIDNGFETSETFDFGDCYERVIKDNKLDFSVLDQHFDSIRKTNTFN